MVLNYIFGNETAGKVLLHIYHYTEIHAAAIAADYSISETQVRNQLERFEKGNILVSKTVGRARLYYFNAKSPFITPLKGLLKVVYDSFSIAEKERLFQTRRRPRKKNKPVR